MGNTKQRRRKEPQTSSGQPDLFAAILNWNKPQGVPLERWMWRVLNSNMDRSRMNVAKSLYIAASWTHGSVIEWERFNVKVFTGYSTKNKAQRETLIRILIELKERGWIKLRHKWCPMQKTHLLSSVELVFQPEDHR